MKCIYFSKKKGYLEKYILSLIDLEKYPQPHSLEKQPQHLRKIDINSLYNMIVHVHVHAQLVGKQCADCLITCT